MKILSVYAFSLYAGVVLALTPPSPPWKAQNRGPTSSYEVTSYISSTLPYLDSETRNTVTTILSSNVSPAYALALVDRARWDAHISSAVAPWKINPDDTKSADAHLQNTLSALDSQLDKMNNKGTSNMPPLTVGETIQAMNLLDPKKRS